MCRNKLLSIIIPIYNSERYLKRCLNSVINQSYKNIEVILIDDGSTDSSPNICDDYAKYDNRIKVIHKKNEGPSLARKDGINVAKGKYITFVDADDYIENNMYEILMNEVSKGVDIIECGYRKVSTTGDIIKEYNFEYSYIKGNFNCALHYAAKKNTTNFLWNKLYKAELFKGVIFPKLYAGEDSCILTQVYSFAEQVIKIDKCLYNYVMTPNSLCRQPFSEKKLDNIKAGKFMYDFYSKTLPNLCGFSALHICSYSAKLYCEIINEDIDSKEEKLNYLLKNFNMFYNLSKEEIVRNMSSKKRVIFVELFKKSPKIAKIIYELFLKL